MKASSIFAVVGLMAAGLASAISTRAQHTHSKKERAVAATATDTVTTGYRQNAAWKNEHGTFISARVETAALGTTTTSIKSVVRRELSCAVATAEYGVWWRPSWAARDPPGSPGWIQGVSLLYDYPSASPITRSQPSQIVPARQIVSATAYRDMQGTSRSTQDASIVGMGICYDMIASSGQCKTASTLDSEFRFLKGKGFGIIRIYDLGCPIGDFVAAASKQGLKLMIGINTISNFDSDLQKLIGMVNGNWESVDTVYICNECVNTGISSPADVAAMVATAKITLQGKGFGGSVITVDTFHKIIENPSICSTSDYCGANIHAYYDPNTSADKAGSFVLVQYNEVVAAVAGQRVVITESGWPWQGDCNGQACPSVDNQVVAMMDVISQFTSQPHNLFLFQAYNAGYKRQDVLNVERHFGIYDVDHYTGEL